MKSNSTRPSETVIMVVSLVLCATLASTSGVAMVREMSFEEVVRDADLVFSGIVLHQTCRFGAGERMIFTDVTFAVEQVIIHRQDSQTIDQGTVVLSFAGGTIGEQWALVTDVPRFVDGERYLVFTKLDGVQYASPVIGSFQGQFHIAADEKTGVLYPLAAGRRTITGVSEGRLAFGMPTESIYDGKVLPAANVVPDRHFAVAPRAAGEFAGSGAYATVAIDPAPTAHEPVTLAELSREIRRIAAAADGR